MALARTTRLRAIRELLLLPKRSPNAGQCREFRATSVLRDNLEEIIMRISAKGNQARGALAPLVGVGPSKPYRLSGEDSEWSENFTMKPLDRQLKKKQLWLECKKAWQMKTQVDGSILNVVRGGFAVSIAGFVAFMPRSMRKTANVHSKFYILNVRADNNELIVGEAEGTAMTWSKLFRFYKRSLQRLDVVVWIKGTVVAHAKNGYCVALAGHLAFLPKEYRRSTRLDSTFRIMTMYPRTGKIVVQEVNTKHFASLAPVAVEEDKNNDSEEDEKLDRGGVTR
ncbi:hypothetical protein SELMODRAFT_438011 [Selaginella moellendorffii]|uniref:30S ribosomal protein S1 n=1 Tax=Selaginella moellendorffii TaxID=88036 RepID=D8QSR6_SELML|nr:uncharacterized protein LOC9663234 [Selaginella moellendorffii]EFJ37484.1 hypothetical protein SELMODRAFT_438011 [Selaginella moellendorffii]|eukprot:XP_002962224.1 uncharacterized protein LOC9663234 [Selaginella moellendorffii]